MKKQDAIKLFGPKQQDMADALKKSKSAISQWGNELTTDQENMVLGAALKIGRDIPKNLIKAA